MRKSPVFFIAASLFFFSLFFTACVHTSSRCQAPAPTWPHESSDLLPDPAMEFGRLDNGFRYILMKNPEPKNRVAVFLDVMAGSLHEEDEQRGMAHFLEHMAFNGTRHFPPGRLVEYLQSIGMRFGPDLNASTGYKATVYKLLLPDGEKQGLDKAFMVMADYARGILLEEKEVQRERGIILAEKQSRDSPGYRTFEASMDFLLPGTRAAKRLPIGTEEIISKTTANGLRAFYDSWYYPANMVLVVVGDFEPETARPLAEKWFSSLSGNENPPQKPDPGLVRHQGDSFFYHYEKDTGATEVSLEVVRGIAFQKRTLALEKQWLLERMANAVVRNRLDAMLEKPDCPFTSARASSSVFLSTLDNASISATCAPEKWEQTLTVLENSLRSALAFGFHSTEVERVKKQFLKKMETDVLEADTRDSTSLAQQIIYRLNDGRVFMHPAQVLKTFSPVIRDASSESLHHAFLATWPEDHRLVMVTGNARLENQDRDPEALIRSVYEKARARKVKGKEEEPIAKFPYFPLPDAPENIVKKEDFQEIGVVRVVFGNQLVLNIKKTDFKKNQVLASLDFGWGKASEPMDRPGMADLASRVVNASGLGPLTREDLSRTLAGTSTRVGFHIHEGRFSFAGSTQPDELELLFQLLYAHVRDPAFREDAFALSRQRLIQHYKAFSRSVDGAMALYGKKFFSGQDPRFGFPTEEDILKLDLSGVENWVRDNMEEFPLEISVVGDCDPEEVVLLCARYLGSLPRRGKSAWTPSALEPGFPRGREKVQTIPTSVEKALAVAAWPTDDIWDIRKTRRLSILADVLQGRLRKVIREKMGATYSPGAGNIPSRTYPGFGYLGAFITVDPGMAGAVVRETKALVEKLASGGITKNELQRSKEPMVTAIRDQVRTNQYWLDTVLAGSVRHPEQLVWARTILTDYASITKEEVQAVAKAYLKGQNAAVFLALPEQKGDERP